MKRARAGTSVGERGQVTIDEKTLAGILGPPPRLPDPNKGWDELVEEAPPPSTWRKSGIRKATRSMTTAERGVGSEVTAP
jgi:hypothetical protein